MKRTKGLESSPEPQKYLFVYLPVIVFDLPVIYFFSLLILIEQDGSISNQNINFQPSAPMNPEMFQVGKDDK